jgi:hypothetical protein
MSGIAIARPLMLHLMKWIIAVVWILLKFLGGYLMTLREDEEGRIQNRIEEWWVRIDDGRRLALSRSAAFIRETARLTGRLFDYVFGLKPISLRIFAVSSYLSIGSFFLLILVQADGARIHLRAPFPYGGLAVAGSFLATGLLPGISPPKWLLWLWYFPLFFIALKFLDFLLFVRHTGQDKLALGTLAVVSIGLCASFFCDVAYVASVRWTLRKMADASTDTQIYIASLFVAVCILLFVVLSLLPIIFGFYALHGPNIGVSETFGLGMLLCLVFNSLNLFVCLAGVVFGSLLLIHRLLWPALARPLYEFQRREFIKNKTALQAVGIALIMLPRPETVISLVKNLCEKLAALLVK